MARSFLVASLTELTNTNAVVTAEPFSMGCWVYIDDDAASKAFTFMQISDTNT